MFADPITVYRALNFADAELVRARLEAAGFMASVSHELAAVGMEEYSQNTGGVRVEVPGDEAADAREFLAEPPEPSPSV